MDKKIQDITDKIYREGVEKGNEEAAKIIAEAQARRDALLAQAQSEAEAIVATAKKQAVEWKKNTEAELKLFAIQALKALKSAVTDLVNGQVISANVKAITVDKAFMQKVILAMATEWVKTGALTIQTADAEALKSYFAGNTKEILDKGVKIEKVNGKDTSFSLIPADGSYKVTFGEEEFVAFFKEYLRPQLVELLF
jgi:V/A-type H+-transporting ATPase subunit E